MNPNPAPVFTPGNIWRFTSETGAAAGRKTTCWCHTVRAVRGAADHRSLIASEAMPPITIKGAGVETRGDRLLASFLLSQAPGPLWINFFRERARSSVLGIETATFKRHRLQITLPTQDDLVPVLRSVEAICEGVNLDVQFRTELPPRQL